MRKGSIRRAKNSLRKTGAVICSRVPFGTVTAPSRTSAPGGVIFVTMAFWCVNQSSDRGVICGWSIDAKDATKLLETRGPSPLSLPARRLADLLAISCLRGGGSEGRVVLLRASGRGKVPLPRVRARARVGVGHAPDQDVRRLGAGRPAAEPAARTAAGPRAGRRAPARPGSGNRFALALTRTAVGSPHATAARLSEPQALRPGAFSRAVEDFPCAQAPYLS